MQIAERVYSLAQEQNDARLMMGAYRVLASTLYFLGDFETSLIWVTLNSSHASAIAPLLDPVDQPEPSQGSPGT
jgi:hypothetical protein